MPGPNPDREGRQSVRSIIGAVTKAVLNTIVYDLDQKSQFYSLMTDARREVPQRALRF